MTLSPQRILAFQGGINFRDLGGYRTRDGRQLRWGRVYRTGVLSYFTPNDANRLAQLGVRAICDLRRQDEREREPTRWPDALTRQLTFDDGASPPTIRIIATRHPNTPSGMHAAMIDLYRELPEWLAPRIRGMFEQMAAGNVPIVVHCAAGKDRTGIAIALLLAVLDIPHATIMQDYLLTNDASNFEEFIVTRQHAQLGVTAHHPLLTLDEEVRRVLFSAHEDFLKGAFDRIYEQYGSLDAYLAHHGIDFDLRHRVRTALLETSDG